VDPSPLYGVSFCTGVGGLELGLKLALGDDYRCIAYCEREAFAAGVLAARMAEGTLDEAVIWDDLTTFPSRLFRDRVAVLSAGFPCQPHSLAGKRKGLEDDRWIWPDIARAIGDIRPRYVFLENVPGLVTSGGLGVVLGDLCALGYDTEWDLFSAEETGAPHKRQRWFCLAVAAIDGPEHGVQRRRLRPEPAGSGKELADAGCARQQCRRDGGWAATTSALFDDGIADSGKPVADAERQRREDPLRLANLRSPEPESARSRVYPPARNDRAGWAAVEASLEPAVCRDVDGLAAGMDPSLFAYRNDRLRAVGNGVVPLTAALAWIELNRRIRT
jgi:DNA (cytosine-5)-methyltransferase 1